MTTVFIWSFYKLFFLLYFWTETSRRFRYTPWRDENVVLYLIYGKPGASLEKFYFDVRHPPKKCDDGVSGSVGTTFNIPKNIYGFVSRALKNKCPGPIIYDSVAVVAEFRFCSACHNLLEKFVDVVGNLISSSYKCVCVCVCVCLCLCIIFVQIPNIFWIFWDH